MPPGPLAPLRQRPFQTIGALALLTTLGAWAPAPALAASFDCEKEGLAADETAICANRDLNDMDVKMVTTFDLITGLMPMGSRGVVQDAQVEWLTKRQACEADLSCLRAIYAERQNELTHLYGEIERPK